MATSAMDQSGIMALPEADNPPQGPQKAILTTDSFDAYKTALNGTSPEGGQAMDVATDQVMENVDQLSDKQLDSLITLLQMMNDKPEMYKEILRRMIEGGNIQEGDFPAEYDSDFIATLSGLLLNAQHRREQSKGAPSGQGIGALPTQMPEAPQGFARGGIAEAVRMVASKGRGGDTMLAHINPQEARMLKAMGGSGVINPNTGLREFDFWDDVRGVGDKIGDFVKGVGDAVGDVIRPVVNVAKEIVKSPVGRILATVALATFLGPAGMGYIASTAVAAGVASAGVTLVAGGSLKEALISGATAYFGAPGGPISSAVGTALGTGASSVATAGITGAIAGTGAGLLQGKDLKESVQQGLVQGAISAGTSFAGNKFGKTGPSDPNQAFDAVKDKALPDWYKEGQGQAADVTGQFVDNDVAAADKNFSAAYGKDESGYPPQSQQSLDDFMNAQVEGRGTTLAGPPTSVSKGLMSSEMNNPNYSDATGQKANTVWQNMKETGRQLGEGEYGKAFDAATDIFAPAGNAGFFRTYAPAIGAGLLLTGATGGFEQKPPAKTELQKQMEQSTLDSYADVKANPAKYQPQGQEGSTYDEKGNLVGPGQAYTYRQVTPQDTEIISPSVRPPPQYVTPQGSLTNSNGPIAQPYNVYDMYTNLMPQYYKQNVRKAATGGIADLGTSQYPRRNGHISGPGTGTSDSIPAMLSDGEFVMTEKAVTGYGGGDRRAGAKKMYALMHQLERNAVRG